MLKDWRLPHIITMRRENYGDSVYEETDQECRCQCSIKLRRIAEERPSPITLVKAVVEKIVAEHEITII